MIQVFLRHECPHCGNITNKSPSELWELRNLPQYEDHCNEPSIIYAIDIISDNAEAALIVEICRKLNLDYRVWDEQDAAEYGYAWEEFITEFFDDSKAIEELQWLHSLLMRAPR